jgi:hypothetical protein
LVTKASFTTFGASVGAVALVPVEALDPLLLLLQPKSATNDNSAVAKNTDLVWVFIVIFTLAS